MVPGCFNCELSLVRSPALPCLCSRYNRHRGNQPHSDKAISDRFSAGFFPDLTLLSTQFPAVVRRTVKFTGCQNFGYRRRRQASKSRNKTDKLPRLAELRDWKANPRLKTHEPGNTH